MNYAKVAELDGYRTIHNQNKKIPAEMLVFLSVSLTQKRQKIDINIAHLS